MSSKSDILVAVVLGPALGVLLISCSSGGAATDGGAAGASGRGGGSGGAAGASGRGGESGGAAGASGRGGGSGGAAGASGRGGAAGGLPAFEARVSANDCSGAINAAVGPVVVDTTITCAQACQMVAVAAGNGDRGLVSFASCDLTSRLVTVEATGVISTLQGPAGSTYARVLSDADGAPYLQAERLTGVGLGFYRLDAQGWWLETVSSALASVPYVVAGRARFAPDGQAYLPYYTDDGKTTLAKRSTDRIWTPLAAMMNAAQFDLAIDSQARPHVLFLTDSGVASDPRARLADWIPGGANPSLVFYPVAETRAAISAAPTTAGRAAGSIATLAGIHVVAQQAGGAATDVTVPNTPYLQVAGCPVLPLMGNKPPTPCTDTGDGIVTHALARTTDALWLAYVWRHVDIDKEQSCFPFENSSTCREVTKVDRSTAEVVVVRLAADGGMTPAPTIVWRTPITGPTVDNYLAVDSTGTRLVLAIPSAGPLVRPTTVRYVMLDAAKL